MAIDIYHSRRTNFHPCIYWIRDERDSTGSPQQWILYNQPDGKFYAKSISVKSNQSNVINGTWMTDSNKITIETDDHVENISRGCIIKYDGDLWLVENVQREEHVKESQFSKYPHYKCIISMTKG